MIMKVTCFKTIALNEHHKPCVTTIRYSDISIKLTFHIISETTNHTLFSLLSTETNKVVLCIFNVLSSLPKDALQKCIRRTALQHYRCSKRRKKSLQCFKDCLQSRYFFLLIFLCLLLAELKLQSQPCML